MDEGLDNEKFKILESNAREYFAEGQSALRNERYNSAVVLFFKTLVSLVDLYLFIKTGKAPSSHGERFFVTKKKFMDVYDLLDRNFPFYQDSYVLSLSKEIAEVIKEDAESMAKKTEIKL